MQGKLVYDFPLEFFHEFNCYGIKDLSNDKNPWPSESAILSKLTENCKCAQRIFRLLSVSFFGRNFETKCRFQINVTVSKYISFLKWDNFQEHDFLRDLNFPLVLFGATLQGRKGRYFQIPKKNHVLEHFSYISFPLVNNNI